MHHQTYGFRSVIEDRDLSRAASERYLMLQAIANHQATPPNRTRPGSRRERLSRLLGAALPPA